MVQGATYLIPVNIDINLNYVDSIIFTLKCGETKVQKEYPSQTNFLKNGNIGIPLNQYETTVLKGLVKIEAQINYKEGRVAKTETDVLQISPTLATKFIDGSESTEPDLDPLLLNTSDPVVAVSGATFIPSVSEDGVISWTNDGDLTNPKPVNIKGKDGKDGAPGAKGATFIPSVSSDGTLSWANDCGLQNPNPVNIKGEDGTTGAPGTPGKNGVTFTPEVSNDGVLSWTNDGNLKNPESVNIKGKDGENGESGDDGITYTPSVSDAGVISWENNGNLPNPEPVNIKGEKGTPGDTPYIGENGNWFIGDTDTGTSAGGTQNAVQYVPQTLTSDQQTQARKNIDAQSQVYAVKRANPWSAEDCVNAPIRGLKLYGASEQDGTPTPENPIEVKCNDLTYALYGRNLINISNIQEQTDTGLTIQYLPDEGCIMLNGTSSIKKARFNNKLKIEIGVGTKITLSLTYISGKTTIPEGRNSVFFIGESDTETAENFIYVSLSKNNTSQTRYSTKRYIVNTWLYTGNGVTFSNYKFRIQAEIGSTVNPYTPYFYGGSVTAPSLYGIGDVRDEWDAMTGNGVRKIVKIEVDGIKKTFNKANSDAGSYAYYIVYNNNGDTTVIKDALCTHLIKDTSANNAGKFYCTGKTIFINASGLVTEDNASASNADALNAILAEKYTAGNPMTFYIVSDDEPFETTPAGQITTPDGYAQFLPSGDGAAGDIEAGYAVDIEKRYVPKETYTALEERVAALESAAIGG